jgi:hypothetical protein
MVLKPIACVARKTADEKTMIVMVSMGRNCVSELQSPTALLLISHVIYERREPWQNDIGRGQLAIHPPEVSSNLTAVT